MPDSGTEEPRAEWPGSLRALASILWGRDDRAVTTSRPSGPPSYREVESYLVVPRTDRARFLVPLHAGRRAATATLRSYSGLRSRRRQASRAALASAVAVGLGRPPVGSRLRVLVPDQTRDVELRESLLVASLSDVLGSDRLIAAFGVPPDTPNAKPTIQLFSPDGRPAGYAKLSWSESSRAQVRNEIRSAMELGSTLTHVHVPRLLATAEWMGSEIVVTEPLPLDAVGWRHPDPPPLAVTEEIATVHGAENVRLAGSGMMQRLRARLLRHESVGTDLLHAAAAAHDAVERAHGDTWLRVGQWHGDWVPWNLATSRATTYAWDWEHSSGDAPIGFDILHWHFQESFIARRQPLADSLDSTARRSQDALLQLQTGSQAIEACRALYLLELTARYSAQHAAGRGWARGFHPQVLGVLERLSSS